MNGPIEFGTDSISFSRMPLQINNSGTNSIAFNDMESRFSEFDIEPMNFNAFDGSLESRLNRELGICPQVSNDEVVIPTSPIPSSPNTQQIQKESTNQVFHNDMSSNSFMPPTHEDFMVSLKEKPMQRITPNQGCNVESLVLYPFRSVYDVEIAVQQMRAFEARRFGHTNS
ncbi:hypothetical protein M9Y10_044117 [Tritrichomonas musculus]|uniref:Uncharacterized protein n=1 Tax=Tritrichomonas musculus TaxID=1915356 RepID=A0ABR2K1L4_9EUKA